MEEKESKIDYTVPKHIIKSIFRSNDIRGTYGKTLNEDVVYAIGLALGSEVRHRKDDKIIVARDGRLSGPTLSKALIQGILKSGCDVIDIDAVPTPFLYFATHVLDVSSGVMLTGSHNPVNDNGLKIVIKGQTASEEEIISLYNRIEEKNFSKGLGSYHQTEIVSTYDKEIKNNIKLQRKLKVVVDCGNGIAGKVVPEILEDLGCEVTELFCEVDGNFPNHHPDPSKLENLEELISTVRKKQADVGLAFDGDGDRVGVITNSGKVIFPDRILMLFAKYLLKENPEATIIYDVKCTNNLKSFILERKGKPLMWKTGHSYIKAKLREIEGAMLAGEMSGHFFFKDRWYGFDDAAYAACRLLEILALKEKSLDELFSKIPDSVSTPELNIVISDEHKFDFVEKFKETAKFEGGKFTTLDGLRVDFDYGFGLVRASRTTPSLVLRFEADSKSQLEKIKKAFKKQILLCDPDLAVPY